MVISDTGIGINVENQQQDIFQMRPVGFKTRLGKGLGLFITKHQIEAMGGKITVESSIDKGTTFKIIFREPKEQKRAKSNENKKIKFS